MNKYIFGTLLTVSMAVSADTCPRGTPVIGVDGETYCQSIQDMNWWSAFAWCEAIGMELISLEDCDGKNGTVSSSSPCPNFDGVNNKRVWTSSVPHKSAGYTIDLSSGSVDGGFPRDYTYLVKALCK